jgi:hypothetical protein
MDIPSELPPQMAQLWLHVISQQHRSHSKRARQVLPEAAWQLLEGDAYLGDAPCSWEAIRPYVMAAVEYYRSHGATDALSRIIDNAAVWWPNEFYSLIDPSWSF